MIPDIRSAARVLGGEVYGGNSVLCPGPGRGHGSTDRSLSVTFKLDGAFVVHSFAGDDVLTCKDFVREKLGLAPFAPGRGQRKTSQAIRLPQASEETAEKLSSIGPAMQIWREAYEPHGTLVERYLETRVPGFPREVLDTGDLKFHPACPFRDRHGGGTFRRPAMITRFRDIKTDEPLGGIHRTAIKPDGSGKALMADNGKPKRMLGPTKRGAIKISPDHEVTAGLALCEGIETGISLLRMNIRPVWVLGSAGPIRSFPVLAGVECLTVYGDHDENGAGQKAAEEARRWWDEAGKECQVFLPKTPGKDWNDVLREINA